MWVTVTAQKEEFDPNLKREREKAESMALPMKNDETNWYWAKIGIRTENIRFIYEHTGKTKSVIEFGDDESGNPVPPIIVKESFEELFKLIEGIDLLFFYNKTENKVVINDDNDI